MTRPAPTNSAVSAALLYTPEVLALAVRLAEFPLREDQPLRGQARSASCGSSLTLGLAVDATRAITGAGVAAQACAVGQAAAAIFLAGAAGCNAADIANAERAIAAWLAGTAPIPLWPGLDTLSAAAAYPGRHGAILLAWRAAQAALSNRAVSG